MYDCILSILFANSFQYFVTVIFKTVENMVADFFRNISRFYRNFCTCALRDPKRPPTHFQDESEGSGLVTPTRGEGGIPLVPSRTGSINDFIDQNNYIKK